MTEYSDWLAEKASAGRADELADLLGHATGFVFDPDLPGMHPALASNWKVRLDSWNGGEDWAFTWANSLRFWSKARDGWLSAEEARLAEMVHSQWWEEIHFGFAEAMEILPRILTFQAKRATKVTATMTGPRDA